MADVLIALGMTGAAACALLLCGLYYDQASTGRKKGPRKKQAFWSLVAGVELASWGCGFSPRG
jgi:hypothetical protein